MANIWKANKDVNNHPNRNNFDLTYQSHLTMKFGTLYPVFLKRVVPGDSFRINTAFGLKFMPMVFPVQSRMRAHMHYFYVRNKNLWKEWENWISGLVTNDEHPHPYISVPDSDFKTSSIHDFLGVPTTVVSDGPVGHFYDIVSNVDKPAWGYNFCFHKGSNDELVYDNGNSFIGVCFDVVDFPYETANPINIPASVRTAFLNEFTNPAASQVLVMVFGSNGGNYVSLGDYSWSEDIEFGLGTTPYSSYSRLRIFVAIHSGQVPSHTWSTLSDFSGLHPYSLIIPSTGVHEYSDLNLDYFSDVQHLNALPYRAYESVYRAYYANSVLQPLRDGNNKPVYNEYITNDGDGADTTVYHLFQRNYELDAYTSALPSPQQGVAPLVGMTALGNVTIEDENGITTAKAEIDDDGTISKVVLTSPAASVEHARVAMNIAASGMSINDFRAGNALTRLLETSLRKGYRYRDFIAGHFGKEPEYRELDMPEFIGGFSRDVNVSTTFASADTYNPATDTGANLGDYVGNASVFGAGNSSVSHYCDDFGFIIGILSVVPTPAYSQLLQKQMQCPSNYLDYFFPEMNQLGLQPITYEEVAPLQRYAESLLDPNKRVQDTFGYQRIYHDYVSSVDEVHGEFRNTMRNYLVNRIFAESPELGDDFLKINPEEVNDIFVNTTPDDDTIIGQIIFDVKAKRPINRILIPGLGR